MQFAAFDPRIKAVVLVAAAYNNPELIRDRFGADNFAALMGQFAQIEQQQFDTGDVEAAFALAPEPKEMLVLDTGNHIDLYDDDTYVLPAIDRAVSPPHRGRRWLPVAPPTMALRAAMWRW